MSSDELICIGEIAGVFGVKGWLKVYSHTDPRANILKYSPWVLKKDNEIKHVDLLDGKQQGKSIVACLEGFRDRNIAESYIGWKILVNKSQLPKSGRGDFYWADLIGLQVVTELGISLGQVDHLIETGANDVLVVHLNDEEHLVPFIHKEVVKRVDLFERIIIVDWDPDF